jgi:hypothetical protein
MPFKGDFMFEYQNIKINYKDYGNKEGKTNIL